ncbi:A/G-specific adenine glycosylase [Ancylobacter novellus DSM 506]|uniref:Adenine DNA glycosylase n=1 Tax=Ancylobacter novellus (strain ATCC 8093 / DSM 506 / JCM 20403 / CCM 1077 / IAM 12100 / NBRC 12443 / NCIMB 10456) TaxID=639283 RepID=D7A3Q4_ANCN5|nr:A/G-specific adenine glycosylase [Ancylobacter novellus]ADH91681.1 A/G-specific adenine glycosylase [Ancylobacter novellus DSM 506]
MPAAANPAARAAPPRKAVPPPEALLGWYDRHRRRLPWRAEAGKREAPYRVFLSEIMLQQTTVVTVRPYYAAFLKRWPDVEALAAAPLEEVLSAWAGLGYYARARNLHACAKAVVARHGGRFPADEAALLDLPGIGPYTAAAIASIAFDRRAAPVDGNWERVVARLFAVDEPLPKARAKLRALALTLLPDEGYGDFAQAMMDLGATICTPRKPACALCPWRPDCAGYATGAPEVYPLKAAKAARPTRRGVAFLAVRADGAVLVRSRPASGLLGGMSEVPSTPWEVDGVASPAGHAPLNAQWCALNAPVTHVFSHFALELDVWRADLSAATRAPAGHRWVRPEGFDAEAFPSVMRKVLAKL